MKLIDADALRQAILSTMPERSEVLLIVDNQPDAVIRCKDCVYKSNTGISNQWLPCMDTDYPDNFYCGRGKRKDGDGE